MNCPNCGSQLEEGARFCLNCGASVPETYKETPAPVYYDQPAQPAYQPNPAPYQPAQPAYQPNPTPYQPTPNYVNNYIVTGDNIPPQNRPLSGWAYWGLDLLFAVPIVGFIFLIVFTFSSGNINRRNFARSKWCWFIIYAIIVLILIATGAMSDIMYDLF